jgi:HrpA-like RNA helicase
MSENARLAQEKSYDIIKQICNTSISGDILLFSTGKEEIKTAVRQLNKIIPASVIALPFYSEMNGKYRDIISDIDKKMSTIRNKKENIAEEWAEDFLDIKDVPEGTYKRAIIIATNVAEASITIETLKYVVENTL